jgi:hypothetical protein
MLSAPDSTYRLVQNLELARGSILEQSINEFVEESVLYWLQGTGDSVDEPDRSGFANGTGTFINRVLVPAANVGTAAYANVGTAAYANVGIAAYANVGTAGYANPGIAGYANFGMGAFASLGTPAFDLTTGQLSGQEGVNVVLLAPRDPWLVATWDLIADHRDLVSGWDGINALAPEPERLDAAEALAILISAKPMRARPQFSVDSDGRPSFALYDDRLYLHLTIDSADRLSWYAVFGGTESFEDDIVFDGTQLPPQLDQLL